MEEEGLEKLAEKEVLNKDLWQRLDKLAQKHNIEWHWVRGHTGHPENERCDELARQAIEDRAPLIDTPLEVTQ